MNGYLRAHTSCTQVLSYVSTPAPMQTNALGVHQTHDSWNSSCPDPEQLNVHQSHLWIFENLHPCKLTLSLFDNSASASVPATRNHISKVHSSSNHCSGIDCETNQWTVGILISWNSQRRNDVSGTRGVMEDKSDCLRCKILQWWDGELVDDTE